MSEALITNLVRLQRCAVVVELCLSRGDISHFKEAITLIRSLVDNIEKETIGIYGKEELHKAQGDGKGDQE